MSTARDPTVAALASDLPEDEELTQADPVLDLLAALVEPLVAPARAAGAGAAMRPAWWKFTGLHATRLPDELACMGDLRLAALVGLLAEREGIDGVARVELGRAPFPTRPEGWQQLAEWRATGHGLAEHPQAAPAVIGTAWTRDGVHVVAAPLGQRSAPGDGLVRIVMAAGHALCRALDEAPVTAGDES